MRRALSRLTSISNQLRPRPTFSLQTTTKRTMASTTPTQAAAIQASRFLADSDPPVCSLKIKDAFEALTKEEKLYSHYVSEACWAGARIIMTQTAAPSEQLYDLVIAIYSTKAGRQITDLKALRQRSGVDEEDFKGVLSYSAQVLSNLSNFKSFGATKFIPRISPEVFEKVVKASENAAVATKLWDELKEHIYATTPELQLTIGKPSEGHMSNYYPSSSSSSSSPPLAPTDTEVDLVQSLCDKASISTLNTRLSKTSEGHLTLLIASAKKELPDRFPKKLEGGGVVVELKAGDFSDALGKVSKALGEAEKFANDGNREGMLKDYKKSFEGGDMEDHIEGSRKWVKDQGPVVESYIGFIESYVDPYGGRAEWEGFVAIVNKEQSKKFNTLVDAAPELIKDLPWGPDFEVGKFQRPDFTALEILSFATSGIPAGINIPNYHNVREHDGFKNVSLSNILSAKAAGEVVTFIAPEEIEGFEKWEGKAFEVQVANHELLGHGTGKLFVESADGSVNFDKKMINPLTGEPLKEGGWYKAGETYGAKIGPVSSSMEECRAESVALYLASNKDILKIFQYETKQDQDDLVYFTFLLMARAGVRALEWYNPATGKHGQAHMEARLGITNWLIENKIASIEEVRSKFGELIDAFARVDRAAVLSRGKEVMGKLLLEIQVRKSLGDAEGATTFYKKLTKPSQHWIDELRPLVLAKKLPRKIFVQPNTEIIDGEVALKEYEVSVEGVVQSFIERGL